MSQDFQLWTDVVQTAGIVAIVAVQIYVVALLQRAIDKASKRLQGAIGEQAQLNAEPDRHRRRLEAVEARNGGLAQRCSALTERLDELEARIIQRGGAQP